MSEENQLPPGPPATPEEAGEWAAAAVAGYIEACNVTDAEHGGRCLVMLMSTAVASMVDNLGPERAHASMLATAAVIEANYRAGLLRPAGVALQ